MKTSKYIQLENELEPYKSVMIKAADAVIKEQISKYPIMVLHQDVIGLGIPIVEKEEGKGSWHIRISTLEEFVSKKVIEERKVDSFRTIYKDPKKFICLFVLSELGAQFVFIPRIKSQPTSKS